MDAEFDNHYQEKKMTKDLHGVEIKHPHASAPHQQHHAAPAPHHEAHHAAPPAHHAPAVHYHTGPEHHHYNAPHHSDPRFTIPHPAGHFGGGHPRQVEHMRHRYNIVPHWNVNRPRPWRADRTPWQDEGGIWHSDHQVFVDDEGVWWDDYGRWRDENGFWHLPEVPGDPLPPYHHPLDGIINHIIDKAADFVTEKVAEEQTKVEVKEEGEKKND